MRSPFFNYLIDRKGKPFHSLEQAINELQATSHLFVQAWSTDSVDAAKRHSDRAMECFDHIVGEIIRARDEQTDLGIYQGSPFETAMASPLTKIVAATEQQQIELADMPLGTGKLPDGSIIADCTLDKTLTKFKHRHPERSSFRIDDDGTHNFQISPTKTNPRGAADSIIEIDIGKFCAACLAVAKFGASSPSAPNPSD